MAAEPLRNVDDCVLVCQLIYDLSIVIIIIIIIIIIIRFRYLLYVRTRVCVIY